MKKLVFIVTCGIFAACSHSTIEPIATQPAVTEQKSETSTDNAASLAQGKALYSQYCGKCHVLFAPEEFSVAKWNHEVPVMAKKSKIDLEKENLILAYVLNGAKK